MPHIHHQGNKEAWNITHRDQDINHAGPGDADDEGDEPIILEM